MDYLKHIQYIEHPEQVVEELMAAYGQDVWNYAFMLTKRSETADDIAQDVFLKAFQNLRNFKGCASPKTWLLTITRNTAYNHMKSAFVRKVMLVDRVNRTGHSRSAESEVMDRMGARQIWQTILKLPAKYREVLILDAHYHLSRKEMAKMLGISEGTVKSRLHRAKKKTNELLKRSEPE